jgi:hypothetical protein
MTLSAIYFLDMKGKVLISRNYRGDIESNLIDKFIGLVTDKEEDGSLTPLICTQECTYAFIKHNNLYVVATTQKNSNIAMIFVLLHKICAVRHTLKCWLGSSYPYHLTNMIFSLV